MEFFTIGVYQSSEVGYFNKLIANNIDTFCDIRQRRGVRGATYAFVNSKRLQKKLNELGIAYRHDLGLAPTKAIRDHQKTAAQWRNITYKGLQDPIDEIPAGTLVRISLARWWDRNGETEARCSLQLSGWYL